MALFFLSKSDCYPYGNSFDDFVPQRNKNLLLSNTRQSEGEL